MLEENSITSAHKAQWTAASIKEDFPILQRMMNGKPLVFLDSAASSQKPSKVIDAIADYYKTTHANVHRGVYQLSQEATEAYERTRHLCQQFLNAPSEREIIFVRGCTEGINLVASSFGRKFFKANDVILLTEMEHHSNIVPWQLIAEEKGAIIKVIPVTDSGELDLAAAEQLFKAHPVAFLAVTHVSNALGTINDVEYLIQLAHQHEVPILLDGAQATPHMAIDVQVLDVDFYVFSAHKMYGPTGMGVLYAKEKWLEAMPPYHGGGEMIETVTFEKTTYNELPFKFEAGTPNIAGGIGLSAAIEYILDLGLAQIAAQEHELLSFATSMMAQIDGIRFWGTAAQKAGVLSFTIDGTHPYDVGALLDKQGVAVRTGHHCTQPLMARYGIPGTVRASLGVYNTEEDIHKLYEATVRAVTMLR